MTEFLTGRHEIRKDMKEAGEGFRTEGGRGGAEKGAEVGQIGAK